MKNLRFLSSFIIALVAFCYTVNTSATDRKFTDEEVRAAVLLIDAGCPSDMGDSMTLTSAAIKDGAIVFDVLCDVNDDVISVMSIMQDSLETSIMPTIVSNPDFEPLIEYCKSNKTNFVMTMRNKNGKSSQIVFHYYNM